MLGKTRYRPNWCLGLCSALTLVLSACGTSSANSTPTLSVEAIYTAAIQTFEAQQATSLALTPPTDTPAPSPFPTLPPASPLPTIGSFLPTVAVASNACDSATYVADITVPDGTVMAPGQKFDKTWKLQNSGSCTWSTSYGLAFVSGTQMGGASSFVKVPVPAGNQTEMTVSLTAPTAAGSYTGTWRMQNGGGAAFGNAITVVITVGSGGTVTPGPSPTPGGGYVTISGDAGATDVTITYSGTTGGTTISDSNRKYSISVPSGWTGTITPSKGNPGHWSFTPVSKSLTSVTTDTTVDFTAVPVTPTSPGGPSATSTP